MTEIDPKLIDVEFRFSGWIPSSDDDAFGIPFPDELIVPRDEWRDRIDDLKEHDPFDGPHPKGCITANYGTVVFDQTPESSCVFNATAGAIQRRWNMQCGSEHGVVLSPMSGYCRVARHRHSGSYMWGALELVSDTGLLPSSGHGQSEKYEHTFHENTPFVRAYSLPDEWQETAKHFRCLEWLKIQNVTQFGSALLNQYPVVYGRQGHSIVAEDLVSANHKFSARSCDSYGFDNRDGTGRIYDSERKMATGGAWACRVVTMPAELVA